MKYGKRRYRRKRLKGRKLNARQKREVKRIAHIGTEIKQALVHFNNQEITDPTIAGAYVAPFNYITQGTQDTNQRVGDSLYLKGFEIRGEIVLNPQAQNQNNNVTCRIIVWQWHPYAVTANPQTNIPITNILENGPTAVPDPMSVYRHDTKQMYKILYDKTYHLVGPGNVGHDYPMYQPVRKFFHKYVNLKKATKHVQFESQGVNCTNNIVVTIFQYPNAAHATTPLAVFMSSRTLYTDC